MSFLCINRYNLKRLTQFVLIIGFIFFVNSKSKAERFEVWTFVGAQTDWKGVDFSLTSANFFELGQGLFLNFTQASFSIISKRAISFGLAYKQEYVKFPQKRRIEYRPMLHLFYTKNWGYFEFRDRNRLEFRFMENTMINRYRNQLKLSYNRLNVISPYVMTEFFFYFNELGYSRQRTALGLKIPIKSVNLDLLAGHQVDKLFPEVWIKKFMLGTSLSYSF